MESLALAAGSDLEARGVEDWDSPRALAAIDDVSALIHSETNNAWVDAETGALVADVPHLAKTICCRAVSRSLSNPEALQAEGIGSYSATYANASSDVYLTKSEKNALRKEAGISSGLGVVRLAAPYSTVPPYPDDIETDL
jgi:hypothetical protein